MSLTIPQYEVFYDALHDDTFPDWNINGLRKFSNLKVMTLVLHTATCKYNSNPNLFDISKSDITDDEELLYQQEYWYMTTRNFPDAWLVEVKKGEKLLSPREYWYKWDPKLSDISIVELSEEEKRSMDLESWEAITTELLEKLQADFPEGSPPKLEVKTLNRAGRRCC